MSGVCQTDINSGLCAGVHRGQFTDVGDKTGFRLTMIDDLHDDRLAMLWDEDGERERRLRGIKIAYILRLFYSVLTLSSLAYSSFWSCIFYYCILLLCCVAAVWRVQ